MKKILLIYHFFHPDSVISARLFSDLAEELVYTGHQVTVFTGNRLIRSDDNLPPHEVWNGVEIRRFARPNFPQGSNFGRLFNSAILQIKWLFAFWKLRKKFDAIIIGTDPQFSYMMFPFMRLMNRKVRLIHWAFDIYPEAILVNFPHWMKLLACLTKPFVPVAYRAVDDMVDIGPCMQGLLRKYRHHAHVATLTPWALVEPPSPPPVSREIREKLFGKAKIGLLYSGTVGYAHDITPFIKLARTCRKLGIDAAFCFAGYGNQYQQQTSQITWEDTNIRLAGFASEAELEERLAAADIHMISLRPGWEGIVVPSKFFGALAIGRPVLFSGTTNSDIANWCREYGIGYELDENFSGILKSFLDTPELLSELHQKAFKIYNEHFSKNVVICGWKNLLEESK